MSNIIPFKNYRVYYRTSTINPLVESVDIDYCKKSLIARGNSMFKCMKLRKRMAEEDREKEITRLAVKVIEDKLHKVSLEQQKKVVRYKAELFDLTERLKEKGLSAETRKRLLDRKKKNEIRKNEEVIIASTLYALFSMF